MDASPTPSSSKQEPTAPERYIYTQADMENFRHSFARKELLSFVSAMGRGLTSYSSSSYASLLPHSFDPSAPLTTLAPALASLHGSLVCMSTTWMDGNHPDGIPPDTKAKARFGNPAFRTWHARLVERSGGMIRCLMDCHVKYNNANVDGQQDIDRILKECSDVGYKAASAEGFTLFPEDEQKSSSKEKEIITELKAYLHDSFGHPIRIDYGTGHESSFIVFLLALCKIGCFSWSGNGGGAGISATSDSSASGSNDGGNSGGKHNKSNPSPEIIGHAALSLFHAYLEVTRGLQRDYMLEPAGSHGVWGLDDYHCVPFYLGACQMIAREQWQQNQPRHKRLGQMQQLVDEEGDESSGASPTNPYLPQAPTAKSTHTLQSNASKSQINKDNNEPWNPSIIHDTATLENHQHTYLYISCIHFIRQIKPNVPFFESSPMLNDISHLANWSKVSSGLLRLYEGEVLDKMPVVQHFVFGKIFSAGWTPSMKAPEAPKWNFVNGPMGDECIAPWAMNRGETGGGGGAGATIPPTNYPGGMPPTRAPWAK
ncbi:hypothetical protein ACHAXS_013960 [Conticribra weissflogii]